MYGDWTSALCKHSASTSCSSNSSNITQWRASIGCCIWRLCFQMGATKPVPVRGAMLLVGTVMSCWHCRGALKGINTRWRRTARRSMSSTDTTVADQSTAAVNASSKTGSSNVAEHDTTRPTSSVLSASHADDADSDDTAVFADRQEQEANSWPARTAARFLSDQARRHSERSTFKLLVTMDNTIVLFRD